MKGLLSRPEALGIRPVAFDIYTHPYRDPGCVGSAESLLRAFVRTHLYALLMFDRQGCGRQESRKELARELVDRLSRSGWDDRCAVIVLDPELEVWVWSDSPHVEDVLGWGNRQPRLQAWLRDRQYLAAGETKPSRPKEAMKAALREARRPRSSSLYRQLAERVSLRDHNEPAFGELCAALQTWFPAASR